MSMTHKLVPGWFASAVALLFCWITAADGQQPPQAKTLTAPSRHAAATDENYVLRTYDVGDLVISVQDHPYSDSLQSAPRPVGGGRFGGGGGGLGGGGGYFSVPDSAEHHTQAHFKTASGAAPQMMLCQFGGGVAGPAGETGAAPPAAGPAITMNDLVRVLVRTVAPETWEANDGKGQIQEIGTAFVVLQTPAVHRQIEELLKQIRQTVGERKTLTIDARWLLLTSDELDSLLIRDSADLPAVDRKALAKFTRRADSIRGLTNCFSGQLVYLVSGTNRNVVSGWIPVVGALENGDGAASLVASRSRPRIQLVADISSASPAKESRVGYQPIVTQLNLGALLEIRPTLMGGGNSGAIIELKSTLTAASEHAPESGRADKSDAIAPAVDRVAIETQELATTLRMPLGKPVLVGGMTSVPGSMKANKDSETSERPQLYLVLEIR